MACPRTVVLVAFSVLSAACASRAPYPGAAVDPEAECTLQLVNRNVQAVNVRLLESSGERDVGLIVPDDRRSVTVFCRDRRVGVTAVADGRSGITLGFHRCVSLEPGRVERVVLTPLTPGTPNPVCRPEGYSGQTPNASQ